MTERQFYGRDFDGTEFSSTWWADLIDRAPSPVWAKRIMAWQVADMFMERHWADVGLQPIFGWDAVQAPGVHFASPTCVQAPRYFGYYDGVAVSAASDGSRLVNDGLDGVEVVPAFDDGALTFEYSAGFLQEDQLADLGLGTGVEDGHEGCMHRSATMPAILMFRMALLARLDPRHPIDDPRYFISSLPTATAQMDLIQEQVDDLPVDMDWVNAYMLKQDSSLHPPDAPWTYIVYSGGIWTFSLDGTVIGGEESEWPLEFWRRGDSLGAVVDQLLRGYI